MTTFNDAVFSRGYETPDDVTVTRPVAETDGLQPEDLGVLVHLLLLPSDTSASAKDLAAGMRALGWKMSVDRFEVIAKRLTKAGHLLRKSVYNPETKRPQWRYWAYRNPAKNPGHAEVAPEAFPQVRAEIGKNPVRGGQTARETGENPVSPGQSRNRVFPDCAAEPGKTRFPSDAVSAGQGQNQGNPGSAVAPPTPPHREEEDSSSPNPSAATAGTPVADPARIAAAGELLAGLPGRWACGRKTVRELAPLLAEAAVAQGWDLDRGLATHLTRRTRKEPMGVLRERIEDLPRFAATRAASPAAPQQTSLLPVAPEPSSEDASAAAPVDPAAVVQARELLLSLTAPWEQSPESAERLAPVLAAKALERGWSFGEELRQQLMSNPGGGSNYPWLLEHKRIAMLPLRTRRPDPGRPAVPEGMCGRHPGFREGDCSACIKAARQAARAAAVPSGADTAAAPGEGAGKEAGPVGQGEFRVPADVVAYVKGLAAGAAADEAARGKRPRLTAAQRRRVAEEQEQARRHEAHNAALNA
ncbi:hypothetical protein ACIPJS_38260 [Streptomyces sp. NPDC086783]|uniref:hypothetical protein n=1 Tax=Streptomyces sp. NPDC086783 TaxID=3365758 RepID=UPI0038201767